MSAADARPSLWESLAQTGRVREGGEEQGGKVSAWDSVVMLISRQQLYESGDASRQAGALKTSLSVATAGHATWASVCSAARDPRDAVSAEVCAAVHGCSAAADARSAAARHAHRAPPWVPCNLQPGAYKRDDSRVENEADRASRRPPTGRRALGLRDVFGPGGRRGAPGQCPLLRYGWQFIARLHPCFCPSAAPAQPSAPDRSARSEYSTVVQRPLIISRNANALR